MALQGSSAPPSGTKVKVATFFRIDMPFLKVVQFFHRPKSSSVTLPERYTPQMSDPHREVFYEGTPHFKSLSFLTVTEPLLSPTVTSPYSDLHVIRSTFLSGSENGFLLSEGKSKKNQSLAYKVPGSLAELRYLERDT